MATTMRWTAVWRRSTQLRVGSVLGVIALLALAIVVAAAVFAEASAGRGAAINVAGSLRMNSYLLAARVADTSAPRAAARAEAIAAALESFERRLHNPQLLAALGGVFEPGPELAAAHGRIAAHWRERIRPLALRAAGDGSDGAARGELLARIDDFVADIDRFVSQLEIDLERRIRWLQLALAATLFVIVVLIVATLFLLDVEVFQPVRELARGADAVRAGDFSARVANVGVDEIGRLGADFNHMVEELARLYGSMEAQIATKTADLEAKNRALALLYETGRELAQAAPTPAVLARIAERAGRVLGAAVTLRAGRAATGQDAAAGDAPALCLPLLDGGRAFGTMTVALAAGQTLAPAQRELAAAVAGQVATALAAAESREEHRRLALLEERSAIARELHDSIAQSLSYAKIQLARLATLIDSPQARAVVEELRVGVATAYRQLRELLTTFRLQLSGPGLHGGLAQFVEDLRARGGLSVTLQDGLGEVELSANEQIHLLQIVREALANVEQHARAQHCWVRVGLAEDGRAVQACVEDDGIGIGAATSPPQHFGLTIMRERARALGGTVDIGARAGGGTRVCVRFVPHGLAVRTPDADLPMEV
ncbi:MAG: histidine kinase [Burkholderiaceae bacterium]|nr:histidine kinase [Burkholderiaceae bacterium]